MIAPPFRFSMTNASGLYLDWRGGAIYTSLTPIYLSAPDKWKETEVKWRRSEETRGLIRFLSTPYAFVQEMASILRATYYTGSAESKINFLIERLDRASTVTLLYQPFFSGEIDLSTFTDGAIYNGRSITVDATVIEGGIMAQLDAAGSTKYPIELGPTSDLIKMDGIKLQNTYTFGTLGALTNITINSGNPMPDRAVAGYFIIKEGDYTSGTTNNPTDTVMGQGSFALGSAQYNNRIFESIIDGQSGRVTFNFAMNVTNGLFVGGNSGPVRLRIKLIKFDASSSSSSVIGIPFISNELVNVGSSRVILATVNIPAGAVFNNLDNGDRLYLTYDVVTTANVSPTVGSWSFDYRVSSNDAFGVVVNFRNNTTAIRSKTFRAVIEELLFKITGQNNVLVSNFLAVNGTNRFHYLNPSNLRLTSGDALRGLTKSVSGQDANPILKISWEDVKRITKNCLGGGIDIRGGKVVIEKGESFFNRNSIIATVTDIKSMVLTTARDYFATAGKWGYPNGQDNKLNGKDAVNTNAVWKYPLSKGGEKDYTVPIYTDAYVIEAARINMNGKKTIDSDSDNDIFAIETEGQTVSVSLPTATVLAYPLYRPQVGKVQPANTGFLFFDTQYNLTLMPILNLYRNGSELRGLFYNLDGKVLTFQTTKENRLININLGGGPIAATADIPVSSLDPAYAKPTILNVEAVLPNTFLDAMRNNPDGCIQIIAEDGTYKGYPLDVGVASAEINSYRMVLLATSDTDLTPKII